MSRVKIIFLGLFLLTLVLRLYNLDINRPNLYSDEVDLHYKTKYWTQSVDTPFYNRIFYGAFTYTWFLGLSPLGVRLPSAVYITISVALLYFFSLILSKQLKINENTALVAMLIGATAPWSILTSRIGFSHISLLLLVVMIHLILYLKAKDFRWYIFSIPPLLLAAYIYQSMLVVAPFVLLMILFQVLKLNKKNLKLSLLVAIISLMAISAIFLFRPNYSDVTVGARGLDLAIWKDVNVTADTNLYRGLARLSQPTIFSFNLNPETLGNKLLYNFKAAVWGKFISNYLSFFSLDFLFLKGSPVLRHSTGQVGSFFPFLLPFILYGGYLIGRLANPKIKLTFFVWILATPIASSLAKDGAGDLIRVITMMPFLTYLGAVGMVEFIGKLKEKLKIAVIFSLSLVSIYSLASFLFGYFQVYPALAAKDFDFGFKEVSDFQVKNGQRKMLVIWDGYYPHWHFRFWQNTPAEQYFSYVPKKIQIGQSTFYQRFDNLYFSLPKEGADIQPFLVKEKVNYIAIPANLADKKYDLVSEFNIIDRIYYPDRSLAFYILSLRTN